MFTLTIYLFAFPREKLNKSMITHHFTTSKTIAEIINFLLEEYSGIPFNKYRYAIGKKYMTDMSFVVDKDTELYVIPPISGG